MRKGWERQAQGAAGCLEGTEKIGSARRNLSLDKCFASPCSKPWGLLAFNDSKLQPAECLGRAGERPLEERLGPCMPG